MKGFGDLYKDKKKKNKPPTEQIINQAIQLHLQGNITEASKYYKQLINRGCNNPSVFSNYGAILYDLGKLQEAKNSFHKAIELNPNFADAHCNLGVLLKDFGKLKEAEVSYRKAIELNPNFADAHSNLGIIFRDLGKLKEAEISTRKAIELNPNFAYAHCNLGVILKDLGKLKEAEVSYRKAIELNPNFADAYSNLGNILRILGKLKEAEISTRKAIEIKPNFADAYLNLGNILRNLGKLKEAEISTRKAIEIKPDYAKGYYSLSLLKNFNKNERWIDILFAENILINKPQKDKVDIFFARANILHKDKRYKESAKYLELANNSKLNLNPSNANTFINKSRKLLIESDKKEINKKKYKSISKNIFIVGMYRSGSTLLESILSMSDEVFDLGEINILEKSFLEYKNSQEETNLASIYEKKVNSITELNITTNKWLYNYQYAGIIAWHMPNAKIIHCFRNPLDNILSIYRGHFAKGNEYSSSLVDCANVYLDQEKVMTEYKKRFRSNIYDFNYDLLVNKPKQEIKSLIDWLGWEWNDMYLSPHLNTRSVNTRSSVEVRSPINSKSIGGWKNYKEMLKPAIAIITQINKYRNLIL